MTIPAVSRLQLFFAALSHASRFLIAPPPATETHLLTLPPFVADLRRQHYFHGIYATVGRELGLSSQHTQQVTMGVRVSTRVLKAIEREYNRIDALIATPPSGKIWTPEKCAEQAARSNSKLFDKNGDK